MSVLLVILSTSDTIPGSGNNSGGSSDVTEQKVQRHFNRAMAMRSLKGLTTNRSTKYRK